ncbi:MAG: hypothetical protein KY445_12490 [Armatimonadetes bacterium]|nr:hypothetical protein [Armatimonadota bacterium]
MSDTPEKQPSPTPKKTPLQLVKERQAALQSNRASKEKRPDPSGDATVGGATGPISQKKMRSSASKQGG